MEILNKRSNFEKKTARTKLQIQYFENAKENVNITRNITGRQILLEFMRILLFWLVEASDYMYSKLSSADVRKPAIERPGLESQRSRKRLFSTKRILSYLIRDQ